MVWHWQSKKRLMLTVLCIAFCHCILIILLPSSAAAAASSIMVSPRTPHASEQHADRAPGQLPLEQGEPPNFSGHKTNCRVQNNEHCSDDSTRELHTLNNNTTHSSNKLLSIPTNCNLPDNTATSCNNLDSPNSFLSAAGSLTSSPSALPNPSTQQPPPFATSPYKHQASAQKKPPPPQQPPNMRQ